MKKIVTRVIIVIAVVAALMLTMHLMVNYFDLTAIMRSIHGG